MGIYAALYRLIIRFYFLATVLGIFIVGMVIFWPQASNAQDTDGACSDWDIATERFDGNDGTATWISWDTDNIYLGWVDGGAVTESRIAAFDLNPGLNDKVNVEFGGVIYPKLGGPDYVVEWNNSTLLMQQRNGASWTTIDTSGNARSAYTANTPCGSHFIEVQISRSLFTGGDVSGLAVGDDMRIFSHFSWGGGVYGAMPTQNFSGDTGLPYNAARYFSNTATGIAPNSVTSISQNYVVTNTQDSGAGSLRDALDFTDTTPGWDTISFEIAGIGPHTIMPTTLFPEITDPVVIDGTTQPGYAGTPQIVLNGSNAAPAMNVAGLGISAGNSTVRGLAIQQFLNGIALVNNGNNIIAANHIGTNATGTAAVGNTYQGIHIYDSDHNIIGGSTDAERNIISGNGSNGILIQNSQAVSNTIQNNYIGTDISGNNDLGNGEHGIFLQAISGTGANQILNNVISGNNANGIQTESSDNGLVMRSNRIGTNAAGTAGIGNFTGIYSISPNVIIGGTNEADRNIISENRVGIYVEQTTTIQGNYIGTDVTGEVNLGNGVVGIELARNTNGTILVGGTEPGAGNLISGNNYIGILLSFDVHNVTIQSNLIGTNAAGTSAVENGQGIQVESGNNVLIGGTSAAARNIISGNNSSGIYLYFVRPGSTWINNLAIYGNYIGTNVNGTASIGNQHGIYIWGDHGNQVIGGVNPGEGNLVSGNSEDGIVLAGIGGNTVLGNTIGLQADGVMALGNGHHGINIDSDTNTIGGTTVAARNTISANNHGIQLSSNANGNQISGNFIGTDISGTLDRGNLNNGIAVNGSGNFIGNTTANYSNLIAFNDLHGVAVHSGTMNRILHNSIHSHGDLGIALLAGGNNEQAPPLITRVVYTGSTTHIEGSITGTPNSFYRIEVFTQATCDPSGFGEGETIIAAYDLNTDENGEANFSDTLATILPGAYVTATATDAAGNTSSFSECLQVQGLPEVTIIGGSILEGTSGTTLLPFTITLSTTSANTITLNYATNDGTTVASSDYLTTTGVITFTPGITEQVVFISINGDSTFEDDESFSLQLSNINGATIESDVATGTILNDDEVPLMSIVDSNVVEGTNLSLTVTLNVASSTTITVDYATTDGTALEGIDYMAISGTATFAPGDTEQVLTIISMDDTLDEADETFTMTLSNVSNAALTDSTGIGTITDNDAVPSLRISDVMVQEGGTASFTVTLTAPSAQVVTVEYATQDETALAGVDYLATSGSLTFVPGVTEMSIQVDLESDELTEGTETFIVMLSNPIHATLEDGSGRATISDIVIRHTIFLPALFK